MPTRLVRTFAVLVGLVCLVGGLGLVVLALARGPLSPSGALWDQPMTSADSPQADQPPTLAPLDPEEFAAQLVTETNSARAEFKRAALPVSACAAEQALRRAQVLLGQSELVHAPLGSVLAACGNGDIGRAAENLARGAGTPQEFVQSWLASPAHGANLLDPDHQAQGIACLRDDAPGQPQMLCAQIFLG